MAVNRVQFQPGLSMFEFLERYGTEHKCEDAVFVMRWPEGFVSPRCASKVSTGFRRGASRIGSAVTAATSAA